MYYGLKVHRAKQRKTIPDELTIAQSAGAVEYTDCTSAEG